MNYYQRLKSIRGSDVHASIHYLSRLLVLGDLESIGRRLMVIVYEDIGLAILILRLKFIPPMKWRKSGTSRSENPTG